MLNALEDWLSKAVRSALPPELTLTVGSMLPPAATGLHHPSPVGRASWN